MVSPRHVLCANRQVDWWWLHHPRRASRSRIQARSLSTFERLAVQSDDVSSSSRKAVGSMTTLTSFREIQINTVWCPRVSGASRFGSTGGPRVDGMSRAASSTPHVSLPKRTELSKSSTLTKCAFWCLSAGLRRGVHRPQVALRAVGHQKVRESMLLIGKMAVVCYQLPPPRKQMSYAVTMLRGVNSPQVAKR